MTSGWKAAALALAAALLIAAGAGMGVWLAAGYYRPQLDQARQDLTECRSASGNLEALAKEQGAKLGELANQAEQRQAKAAQAVAASQQQADQHYAAAQRLQQERVGGDQCAAAEAIIDQELGL